jgi:hypothetical protein
MSVITMVTKFRLLGFETRVPSSDIIEDFDPPAEESARVNRECPRAIVS